jgi:hypothetical protein
MARCVSCPRVGQSGGEVSGPDLRKLIFNFKFFNFYFFNFLLGNCKYTSNVNTWMYIQFGLMKIPRNYRISEEVDQLLKAEAARLSGEQGRKVSEADVIELAVIKWCAAPADVTVKRENRREREQEVEARAKSDLTARLVGREEIDYSDVESTPMTHVATLDAVGPVVGGMGKASIENWRAGRKPLLKPGDKK